MDQPEYPDVVAVDFLIENDRYESLVDRRRQICHVITELCQQILEAPTDPIGLTATVTRVPEKGLLVTVTAPRLLEDSVL